MNKRLIAFVGLLLIPTSLVFAHAEDGQEAHISITQQENDTSFASLMHNQTMETVSSSQQTMQQTSGSQALNRNEGFTIVPLYPNTINPRKFLFEIKPGEQAADDAYIKNFSDDEITVLLYGADPTVSNTGSLAYKTRQNVNDGPGSWIKFDEPQVDLKPQEGKKVHFTVSVPKDTPLGDYKAGIAIEKTKKDINNPSITIATRVIIHAEIKVTNEPKLITKGEPAVKETAPVWKQYYFWGSLALFIFFGGLLIWVTTADKKSSKRAKHDGTKHEPAEHTKHVKKTSHPSKKPQHHKKK